MSDGRPTSRRIAVGAVLLFLLLVVAAFVFFLDDLARATEQRYELIGLFPTADAVRPGVPVRVAGHPVGRVVSIEVVPATSDANRIAVTMELPRRVAPHVRSESRLRFVREGLMGSAVIDIVPGPPAQPLQPGDTLVYVPPPPGRDRVARSAAATAREVDSLMASIRALARESEPNRRALQRLGRAVSEAQREFDRLQRRAEGGSLAALARDTTWRAALARLARAVDEVRRAFEPADAAAGDLAAATAELRSTMDRTLRRAGTLSRRLERLERLLAEPRGFPSRMAQDTALDAAIRAVRAQIDSMAAEARARPWRFLF